MGEIYNLKDVAKTNDLVYWNYSERYEDGPYLVLTTLFQVADINKETGEIKLMPLRKTYRSKDYVYPVLNYLVCIKNNYNEVTKRNYGNTKHAMIDFSNFISKKRTDPVTLINESVHKKVTINFFRNHISKYYTLCPDYYFTWLTNYIPEYYGIWISEYTGPIMINKGYYYTLRCREKMQNFTCCTYEATNGICPVITLLKDVKTAGKDEYGIFKLF